LLWCVGLLLFTQVPAAIVSVVILAAALVLFPDRLPSEPDARSLLQNPIGQVSVGAALVVAHALIIGFALLLLRIVAGRDWPRQVALRRPAWAHVGLILVVMPALMVLGNAAYFFFRRVLHVPSVADFGMPDMEEMEGLFGGWAAGAAVFAVGVMPALSEELWCRAFLGRGLVGRHGVVLGVLGTSFLFGFIHVDPCQGLMAMLMGVMIHYVYLTTRSLLAPMLVHFLNNSLAVTLARVPAVAQLDKLHGQPEMVSLYTGAAVLVACVCWALYQSRARLVFEREGAWTPPWPGVACPPPGAGTRIDTPWPSALSLAAAAAGLTAFLVGLGMTLARGE
jgi:membrane protease YdiL (CAAX protease family)